MLLVSIFLAAVTSDEIAKRLGLCEKIADRLIILGTTFAGTASLSVIFHNKIKRALKSKRRDEIFKVLEMMKSLGIESKGVEE